MITIDLGDITILDCNAIVNAANKTLLGGGGVDGAIHRRAGSGLLAECRTLGGCETGKAKITKGYKLKAKYIIHTVGPIYSAQKNQAELLANCYKNSLDLALKYDIHSIAFPAISTGVYHYPLEQATKIAITTVKTWLKEHIDYNIDIIFSCFDEKTYTIYKQYLEK